MTVVNTCANNGECMEEDTHGTLECSLCRVERLFVYKGVGYPDSNVQLRAPASIETYTHGVVHANNARH
jgi:hypothetical protein